MIRKLLFVWVTLFTLCCSFNAFAMENLVNGEYIPESPKNEVKHDNHSQDNNWTWLSDEICVQFSSRENTTKAAIQRLADYGLIRRWGESDGNGGRRLKTRDTYSGKWSQAENGTWSFVFDDGTIPIDLTKIDGVLYAFNGYGELVDGYEYWNGQKTGPDGVATCTDPEFVTYLRTQYLPDCTSHK